MCEQGGRSEVSRLASRLVGRAFADPRPNPREINSSRSTPRFSSTCASSMGSKFWHTSRRSQRLLDGGDGSQKRGVARGAGPDLLGWSVRDSSGGGRGL